MDPPHRSLPIDGNGLPRQCLPSGSRRGQENIEEREEDEENEQKEDEEEGSRVQSSYYEVGGQSRKKSATHSRTQGNSEIPRKIRTRGKSGQREYLVPT
jgi:hypothetical protein